MNNSEKLKKWREDRHLQPVDVKVYVENIVEELLEMFYTDKLSIEEQKKEIMKKYFDIAPLNENAIIDAICDIQVFSENQIELIGYDNEMCMSETIDEISSREQDPMQKEIWEKWGYDFTKWQKNQKQPKDTLYKANYEKCKR